jgi:hypothetical protein
VTSLKCFRSPLLGSREYLSTKKLGIGKRIGICADKELLKCMHEVVFHTLHKCILQTLQKENVLKENGDASDRVRPSKGFHLSIENLTTTELSIPLEGTRKSIAFIALYSYNKFLPLGLGEIL